MDIRIDMDIGPGYDAAAEPTTDSGIPFNLFGLPCEVRLHVYRSMELQDLLNMRRASKESKTEIDGAIDFDIRIDDRVYKRYRRLFELRVRSCNISNWTFCHKHSAKLPTFKFPNHVKGLTLNGPIKKRMIQHVLTECPSLESLTCTHEILGRGSPNAFEGKMLQDTLNSKLPNLTSLHLQLIRYPPQDSFYDFHSNIKVFLLATFPALKSFTLDYIVWNEWTELFKFLLAHAKTLERVNLRVGEPLGHLMAFDYSRANVDSKVRTEISSKQLGQLLRLKEFAFHDKILHLNPTKQLIIDLLKAQQSLETLNFCCSKGQMTINELSSIVLANEATLTNVTIEPLKNVKSHRYTVMALDNGNRVEVEHNNEFPVAMDMKLFAECEKLQSLSLLAELGGTFSPKVELTNLRQLPHTLVKLQLSDYALAESYKSDVLEFTRNCPNLKHITLIDITSYCHCSVQYSFLMSTFLNNCEKLKYFYMRPILYSRRADDDQSSELVRLVGLYQFYLNVCFDPEDDLNEFEVSVSRDNIIPKFTIPIS